MARWPRDALHPVSCNYPRSRGEQLEQKHQFDALQLDAVLRSAAYVLESALTSGHGPFEVAENLHGHETKGEGVGAPGHTSPCA